MSTRIVISSGRRKTARARAVIQPGKGRVWINGIPIEIYPIELARLKMMEPLLLAGELRSKVDIRVNVRGGGYMGQAEAAAIAIARGLLAYAGNNETLRTIYTDYNRVLLAGDPRQTEPKKWMRYSARRRKQKSYR
jgi:small subunit ribosomal protein S9